MSRRAGWLLGPIQTTLRCKNGHHVRDGWLVTTSHCVRCQQCSSLIWVITTQLGAAFVADVTHDDVQAIKAHASIYDTLRFLGAPAREAA